MLTSITRRTRGLDRSQQLLDHGAIDEEDARCNLLGNTWDFRRSAWKYEGKAVSVSGIIHRRITDTDWRMLELANQQKVGAHELCPAKPSKPYAHIRLINASPRSAFSAPT